MSDSGELAIVLHTHMPYVEGFGTWPFGEEWLWEAMARSYLPLADLLDAGAPLTLSLTPVLCDQLEAPGLAGRFERFIGEVRERTLREDAHGLADGGDESTAAVLEEDRLAYHAAADGLRKRGGDLLGGLAGHATWSSSATHAVLPLIASDQLLSCQVRTGLRSHTARCGRPPHGFWLPECAYAPHLAGLLADAGVRLGCVELSARHRPGSAAHLRPLACDGGLILAPIDRVSIDLVWSASGYPAGGAYRDSFRRTFNSHNPWSNAGAPYDRRQALQLARADAQDFVARVKQRLGEHGRGLPGGGLVVFAADSELFGLWWHEGVHWLAAVVEECRRQGLRLLRLEQAAAVAEPLEEANPTGGAPCSWGDGRSLLTWSGAGRSERCAAGESDPEASQRIAEVAEMAVRLRAAERRLVAAGAAAGSAALRALLAAQASDWAFMAYNGSAVPYARERFNGHLARLERELAGGSPGGGVDGADGQGGFSEPDGAEGGSEALRGIAAHADIACLAGPPPPAIGLRG